LTTHKGYEMFARYSPDGKSIAFTGEYDGNREVYLMPSEGGVPQRLTFTSTNGRDELGDRMGPNNIVMTWNPDGKNIVFRNRIGDGFPGKLWSVSTDGTMPVRLPLPEGGFCSYSPDGKKLAYNRVMREFRTWKYYRGGMADDIWIYDGKKVENITGNIAQDIFPMWCGDKIFFASDRDMTMNIFVYDTKNGRTSKVTDFHDYDVKFPSTDGTLIVFEQAGYIWKLDTSTLKYEKISIRLSSDDIYARPLQKNVSGRISSVSLSSDGTRLAITARGDVFDVPAAKGVTRNITRTPGANERGAVWSPDGRSIAFISDRTGETEVWLQNVQDETMAAVPLTSGSDTYIRTIKWSPDSKKILCTDRKNRVLEIDSATKNVRVLLEEPRAEFRQVNYSADGKWLTYTRPQSNEMSVVYVYEIATGKEYPVTERWYDSSSPVFSEDGRYLMFNSSRDLNPVYSYVEWNYAYTNMNAPYIVMLAKDTPSPLLPKDGEPAVNKDDAGAEKTAKTAGETEKSEAGNVKIDPEGIADRIVKLPFNGRIIYSDGKKVWYSGQGETRVYDFASGKDEQ
ncbi:MAG: PD40 domain-containing protein, partial [Alistipes sp.]|nr:PD40 domain-containing protein [Candidatus Minthomonas equi]